MGLVAGDRLGPYEIVALIGAGGMGEVWRALDTRIGRTVAIKTAKDHFSERFEQEARAVATLNHPNICTLFDVGDDYLVMEFVDGPTLHQRIQEGPVPLTEAIPLALQIAEAIEAAHEKAIIHRDLKPANIKITPEGRVKVLDFGLAKALDEDDTPPPSGSDSPTVKIGVTRKGVILGTAAYMSPEQAVGKPADRRGDIFSFGAVLFEMLTATHAFTGESMGDTLAAVVKDDPDWGRLPADTPEPIRTLLRRCLVKDRKRRLQAIGEARILLENPASVSVSSITAEREAEPRGLPHWLPWTIAGVMTLLALTAVWNWRMKPAEPRPVMRFSSLAPLRVGPGGGVALSPDGSRLAFIAEPQGQIFLRAIDQMKPLPVMGTENSLAFCFSPGGQWIAFLTQGLSSRQLKKVPVTGGATQTLADNLGPGAPSISWGEDDNILVRGNAGQIASVGSEGGPVQTVLGAESAYGHAQLLPGGKGILFTATGSGARYSISVLTPETGKKTTLVEDGGPARFAPSGPGNQMGHIVFWRDANLFAVPFDLSRLQTKGAPTPVVEGVQSLSSQTLYGFSDKGTLAYVPGRPGTVSQSSLVWVDRKGTEQAVVAPARGYAGLRLSPDGARVALLVQESFLRGTDLWVYDLGRGTLSRLTFDAGQNSATNNNPVWTPDGRHLVFTHDVYRSRNGAGSDALVRIPSDGGVSGVNLLESDASSPQYFPASVSPDGRLVIGRRPAGNDSKGEVWVLPLTSGAASNAKPQPVLDAPYARDGLVFSPDGKWLAYHSAESGRNEVYVISYPEGRGKFQISAEGGTLPRWGGRELFYRNGNQMMVVSVQTGPTFRTGTPRVLFEREGAYDVAPDGSRFLMIKTAPDQAGQNNELHIVVNWFEELRRRAPATR